MDWAVLDYGTFGSPSKWLVQGLYRWPLRARPAFRAYAVVIPLHTPTDAPHSSWSTQLVSLGSAGGRSFDNPTPETRNEIAHALAESMNHQGIPFLETAGLLRGFRDLAHNLQQEVLEDRETFWYAEEVGYTDILLGDYQSAEQQLERQATETTDEDEFGLIPARRRCGKVLALLRQDPQRAVAQLDQWADKSAAALKVTRQR